MKGRVIVTDEIGGRGIAALVVNGRLEDVLIDPPETDPTPRPGALHWGRVTRRSQNAGAVFVDLGEGLSGLVREAKGLAPGDMVLAQVTGYAEGHKAVPMTTRVLYKGRYAILTPHAPGVNVARRIRDTDEADRLKAIAIDMVGDDTGVILRSAAAEVEDGAIRADLDRLMAMRAEAEAASEAGPCLAIDAPDAITEAWRDWVDPDPDAVWQDEDSREGHLEHFGVWEALEALAAPGAEIPGGGHIYVEPTRAVVAVDVNTGRDFSPAACLKANLEALKALPRQLRLRGLGGVILVDLAPLAKKERKQVESAIRTQFRTDPVETSLAGWTPLGSLELQRKRERRPLAELLPFGRLGA